MTAAGEPRACSCCRETAAPAPKESEPAGLLCYCFGHSLESLRTEWEATGRLDSVDAIRTAIREGRCRCDQMNPSGTCCLGDVVKAAQIIRGSTVPRPGRGQG
jgi:hypothetical protein